MRWPRRPPRRRSARCAPRGRGRAGSGQGIRRPRGCRRRPGCVARQAVRPARFPAQALREGPPSTGRTASSVRAIASSWRSISSVASRICASDPPRSRIRYATLRIGAILLRRSDQHAQVLVVHCCLLAGRAAEGVCQIKATIIERRLSVRSDSSGNFARHGRAMYFLQPAM